MKRIELVFDKTITSLAGNTYGQSIFSKQIGTIDYDESYEIVFPTSITIIATSFIQGFFDEFIRIIGLEGIEKRVNLVSSISNFKQYVLDCLK